MEEKKKSSGISGIVLLGIGIVAVLIIGPMCTSYTVSTTTPTVRAPDTSPSQPVTSPATSVPLPIAEWLSIHSEFGTVEGSHPEPDWAKGPRLQVETSSGKELLFYLENGDVEGVYKYVGDGREEIYRKPGSD